MFFQQINWLILQIIVMIAAIKLLELIKQAELKKWYFGPLCSYLLPFSLGLQNCLGECPLLTTAINNLPKSNKKKIEIYSSFSSDDKKRGLGSKAELISHTNISNVGHYI